MQPDQVDIEMHITVSIIKSCVISILITFSSATDQMWCLVCLTSRIWLLSAQSALILQAHLVEGYAR